MAIKKKGNTGFLNGTTVEKFDNIVVQDTAPVGQPQKEDAAEVGHQMEQEVISQPVSPTITEGHAKQDAGVGDLTEEDLTKLPEYELIKKVAQQIIKHGGAQGIAPFDSNAVQKMGRPRQELIKGIHEVSVNLQLPENLVQALRAKAKAEKKSMKELIGRAVMDAYPECWANK